MDFHFTDEQEQFREFVHRFLNDVSPTTEVRRIMDTDVGFDASVWARVCNELYLTGISIPEKFGGSGFGVVELCIALEEMGHALFPSPFFSTAVLAAKSIEFVASEEQQAALLPQLAAGEKLATLAFMERSGAPDLEAIATIASKQSDGYKISGLKTFVVDGGVADVILVTALIDNQLSLLSVDANAAGIVKKALNVMDPTRKLSQIEFVDVSASLLGEVGQAKQGLLKMLDIAYIALANESVGGTTRLFDDTLDYVKLRRQFGRTIASFQAIKHRMTDYLLAVELAKSAAYYAAQSADDNAADLSKLASLTKAGASEAYLQAAIESTQLHGGIGFTWENDTHLWFKRAKSSEVFLGDPSWHRARMVQFLIKEQAA